MKAVLQILSLVLSAVVLMILIALAWLVLDQWVVEVYKPWVKGLFL